MRNGRENRIPFFQQVLANCQGHGFSRISFGFYAISADYRRPYQFAGEPIAAPQGRRRLGVDLAATSGHVALKGKFALVRPPPASSFEPSATAYCHIARLRRLGLNI